MPEAWGNFLASLAVWDWFIHLTFRDEERNQHPKRRAEQLLLVRLKRPNIPVLRSPSDWVYRKPHRSSPSLRGPAPDWAMKRIREYLCDVEHATGQRIGWVIAEEFGRVGGRWHCHGLVTGVSKLNRKFWWAEAFRRFGRARIAQFDRGRAATFYAAKYEAKQLGMIHTGGVLAGVDLSRPEDRSFEHGGNEIVSSAPVERRYFRCGWDKGLA